MTCGFQEARLEDREGPVFEPVFAVEYDKHAAETYRLNFDDHLDDRPIQEIPSDDFPEADVLIGGPPCQGFSALNRNRDGDMRRELWREYVRALEATQVSFFVMENVPQLLDSPEYAAFREYARKDWQVVDAVLNAADYGVPQTRRRAIVIGSRVGEPALPRPSHAAPRYDLTLDFDGGKLLPWVTVRDAIGHLPIEPDGLKWHRSRNATLESRIRYRHVPIEGDRFKMQAALDAADLGHLVPRCWREKPRGTTDVFGRMWWDKPAPTLRTEFYKPEKGRYLHPVADRPITIREGALLMGFPETFEFPEHQALTHVGRQIGNAVPPLLAKAIGQAVAGSAVASQALIG
jgi:DNA (cytosine-5)-methyltransferase 1